MKRSEINGTCNARGKDDKFTDFYSEYLKGRVNLTNLTTTWGVILRRNDVSGCRRDSRGKKQGLSWYLMNRAINILVR